MFDSYEDLLEDTLMCGVKSDDRTGVGTRSVFGRRLSYYLPKGFPLLTTKRVHYKAVIAELLWFLSGSTNVKDLQALGCSIWDEWADPETGELGPVYGYQWRNWNGEGIDQIAKVIESIRKNPASRRHIVSAWNPSQVDSMALPPCHALFQFRVDQQRGELDCQIYQRSADLFLGVPFNLASYALLTHMVAAQCGLRAGELIWVGGDVHIYNNHVDQVRLQLDRNPRDFPTLWINPEVKSIFEYSMNDFRFDGYDPHPSISAPIAV